MVDNPENFTETLTTVEGICLHKLEEERNRLKDYICDKDLDYPTYRHWQGKYRAVTYAYNLFRESRKQLYGDTDS